MAAIKRILEYLENKGITKYKFYKITGLSNGFLDKDENIGSDKCEIIFNHFNDLNLEWLITGKGSMLKYQDDQEDSYVLNEPHAEYQQTSSVVSAYQKTIKAQETTIQSQKQTIAALQEIIKLKEQPFKKGTNDPARTL